MKADEHEARIDRVANALARILFVVAALVCFVASNYMPIVPQVITVVLGIWCLAVTFFAPNKKD
jgi:hypothetical protein